jgi:hypothetical protein
VDPTKRSFDATPPNNDFLDKKKAQGYPVTRLCNTGLDALRSGKVKLPPKTINGEPDGMDH